jgi:DNA-binding IclR family transcriptional regulator
LAPAHCTSLGKALLAQLTDEQVMDLYPTSAEPFPARTDKSITTQARLLKELAKARERGYAVNSGETEEDVGSVAIAFRDFAGRPAAIAVAAPTSRLSAQRVSRIGQLMGETIARTPIGPGIPQVPAD